MQVANPNRAQFTKCARTAIPYTTPESRGDDKKDPISSLISFIYRFNTQM